MIPRRLHKHHLLGQKFFSPIEVIHHFGALQAQDFLPAMWALGLRTEGATETIVEQAVIDGQIVRTWPFRGTIHFVTPADIRWMLELSAPRSLRITPRHRDLELDEATFARSRRVIAGALRDGRPHTRPSLYRALDEAGISPAGQRGIHILGRLAQEGLICIGPREGKQQTFVLLDAWVPPAEPLSRDEALAELARRYFTSHGPATARDFIWWSGLPAAEARAGLEMAKPHLVGEMIGQEAYWLATTAPSGELTSPTAHFLPFLDEYLVAYRDRDAALPPAYNALTDSGNVIFHQPIIIDGLVAGIWTRKLKKNVVEIAAKLFRPLSQAESEALSAAAGRFAAFLGLASELKVTWK